MIQLSLLIRKTKVTAQSYKYKRPLFFLQSNALLMIEKIDAPYINIDICKGNGFNATIANSEDAFVKFLLHNYGPGSYHIQWCNGSFTAFWVGVIDVDRYYREGGKLAPYIKSRRPKIWYAIANRNVLEN
jgi:hypothetical protein